MTSFGDLTLREKIAALVFDINTALRNREAGGLGCQTMERRRVMGRPERKYLNIWFTLPPFGQMGWLKVETRDRTRDGFAYWKIRRLGKGRKTSWSVFLTVRLWHKEARDG